MSSTASPDTTRNRRALLSLWALFWLLMVVVSVEDNRDDPGIRWWEPVVWELTSALIASVWLLLARRAHRRWESLLDQPMKWFGRHLAWLPVMAITFVFLVYPLRHGFYALTPETYEHDPLRVILFYEAVKLSLFASLWIGIIFGLESFTRWKREREQLLTLQKDLAESQLARLRAQLQPHFLFNTLNTISSLMQVDITRADKLLTQLADLLRASLTTGARNTTSLCDELNLLRLYASIMQERFAGRVTIDWRIEADTLDGAIPAMLLQPLLENAFKHGVERSAEPVDISIQARRDDATLTVEIRNSRATLAFPTRLGIGVTNCRERLALLFGDAARIDLQQDGDHVLSRVTLPWRRLAA
jgi:two-component system, LytTR family, sensor kinase